MFCIQAFLWVVDFSIFNIAKICEHPVYERFTNMLEETE